INGTQSRGEIPCQDAHLYRVLPHGWRQRIERDAPIQISLALIPVALASEDKPECFQNFGIVRPLAKQLLEAARCSVVISLYPVLIIPLRESHFGQAWLQKKRSTERRACGIAAGLCRVISVEKLQCIDPHQQRPSGCKAGIEQDRLLQELLGAPVALRRGTFAVECHPAEVRGVSVRVIRRLGRYGLL